MNEIKETTELFPTHLDSELFRRFKPSFGDEEYYLLKHKGSVYILLKKVGYFLIDDVQNLPKKVSEDGKTKEV